MDYTSPMLFKMLPSGAMRQWKSWSKADHVYTEFGQVGGKLQQSRDIVFGKNTGRANATTPQQQAAFEAESLADKMIKKGYVVNRDAASKTQNSLPAILPMLAHVYADVKNPVYPAYVQPKLDGVRCLAVVKNGKAKLYTRSQKIIDTVPRINAAVEKLAERSGIDSFVCDGELYNHKFADDFGRILGAIKRKGIGKDEALIHYYIYDLTSDNQSSLFRTEFSTRTRSLVSLLRGCSLPIVRVETLLVNSEAEMYAYAKKCMHEKYEGCMYRVGSSFYEGKRSKNLLKVKVMLDSEYEVVGFQEGTGKLMGKVGSFHCKTETGVEFKAKLEGALDELPDFKDGKKYIGKILTVRYQCLTPDGSPRFPVGVKFKDGMEI